MRVYKRKYLNSKHTCNIVYLSIALLHIIIIYTNEIALFLFLISPSFHTHTHTRVHSFLCVFLHSIIYYTYVCACVCICLLLPFVIIYLGPFSPLFRYMRIFHYSSAYIFLFYIYIYIDSVKFLFRLLL